MISETNENKKTKVMVLLQNLNFFSLEELKKDIEIWKLMMLKLRGRGKNVSLDHLVGDCIYIYYSRGKKRLKVELKY